MRLHREDMIGEERNIPLDMCVRHDTGTVVLAVFRFHHFHFPCRSGFQSIIGKGNGK
jgi:hypothetical protein